MMIRRILPMIAAALAISSPAAAQTAHGEWGGTMDVEGTVMRIVVHIDEDADGAATGTADSPDQNVYGIPLAEIEQQENRLTFTVPSVRGSFAGEWVDGTWVGEWRQGRGSLPLTLRPGAPAADRPPAMPADWSIPDDAAIGDLLNARIADRPGVGMVVGVMDDTGQRFIARGPAGQAAFTTDTLFEIGSLTKLFTSLLLADMSLRGEVSPDDPARRYLPDGATMPTRNGREITLRDLAMHVSGLPRLPDNLPNGDPANPYADYTQTDLLAFLRDYQLPRDIGSQFEYSNLGVGLLAYLLERAAGQDYETLLRERITGPLGMADTAITLSPEQRQRVAPGRDAYLRPAPPWDFGVLTGAGGVWSDADDLLTFAAAVIDPQSPIAAAVQRTLQPRQAVNARTEVGLGWLIAHAGNRELLLHGGGTGGYRAAIMIDREGGEAAVVLTNTALEPAADDMSLHLLTGNALARTAPPPQAPVERATIDLTAEQMDRVTGRYALSPTLTLEIRREGDGLRARLSGQPAYPIYAAAPLEFFWRVIDAQITFLPARDGTITGALLKQNGSELAVRRIGPVE